ncbi:RHS repeat-associated core domain-containing protein [Chryseobacterium sp. ES2]|uniref:RHS repeat-associated core domain-containing protein n=1 Tax=Chryseobacterium metallicongregator TaxID=3073042 RepID=A0ABU1E033_9FLAO|nr:RHS repeat-associated core domain-containing protein [Chryseobacterium sp. ES2]MDR4951148.1 RHS repeat-associated core domain-containing protein [Chryseobacterium sp. ES2]
MGNVRVSYGRNSAGALEITDANDYYPFGMNHLKTGNAFFGSGSYKNYKYNGKELQETGMYDYGARFYMPDLGRWGVIDPLAEVSRRWSPYNYVLNNPISHIDPDGRLSQSFMDELWNKSGNNTTWTNDGNGNFSDGNGNAASDSGPGPKGSWGGVSWSGFINNWNFEDTVEFYQANVRARVGTLKSVNGNATLNVKQTAGQWDKEYGWMPWNRTNFLNENTQNVTNCYGYVLTNGYFFVDDSIENIRGFLLDSGYKSSQAAGKNFKVGDILLWDGHMIEATGKKNGGVVWSSYFGFDSSPAKGSLQEIMNYNKGFGRAYGSLQGATLYRQQDQSKIQFGQKKYEAIDVKTIQQQKNSY